MEYKFNCSCGQLLVRGNPVHKDITCNCSKTFTFFNGEYREYELGQIVTNVCEKPTPSGVGWIALNI